MNTLVLNEKERNFEIDPPFHWIVGTQPPDWFKPFLSNQTLILHSLRLGSNLSVYGNTVQKINGLQTTQYVHIREGNYTWSEPLYFISFHIDKMNL